MKKSDRELGMAREISRRDFVNGVSVAIGGAMLTSPLGKALEARQTVTVPQGSRDYYPPALSGMRGSHEGSFEVAHAMREGKTWDTPEETGELYDLIVVGGSHLLPLTSYLLYFTSYLLPLTSYLLHLTS